MSNPKISIITVCFNAVSKLEGTIKSVVNQDYNNVEYIIIDGGSQDGSVDLIKKYNHQITRWISEPDEGIYPAMNKGIEISTGDWVYFLGAGDTLLDILSTIAPKLNNRNYIYYGDVYRNDLKAIYGGEYSGFKLAITNICHQAIFYPLAVLKKYGYHTKYKLLADHHLNMRCYGDKHYQFHYLPLKISIYEGDGISAAMPDPEFYNDKINIIRENFSSVIFLYAYLRRSIAKILKNR